MRSSNYSIVILESEIVEEMYDDIDKEEEEKLIARKRCTKLVFIPLVSIISFGFLAFSIVHDVQARARSDQELENDQECLTLLCPVRMG